MNPTKKLNSDLRKTAIQLSETKGKLKCMSISYASLEKSMSVLIDSNIKLEKEHDTVIEALGKFCYGCTERDSGTCKECYLQPWLR